MANILRTQVGAVELKNPLIAGSAEHFIEPSGVRRAIEAGVGAVVVKSVNESQVARDQLQRAEYVALDEKWLPIPWGPTAPAHAYIACRSGLTPLQFDAWLEQTSSLDLEAKRADAYVVASVILAELPAAVSMARQIEQAGLRILELNIGTPYASEARGAVSTVLEPERVTEIVRAVRAAVSIPLWAKISGQSERVPELAAAAFDEGCEAVVMAGRSLGFIPDVETFEPMLGTALGVGGYWNLPITCRWLALARARLGKEKSLIATNGAQSGLDVARMMLAGASAVQMSSPVMLRGFGLLSEALLELEQYLIRKSIHATDLTGLAADARKGFHEMPLRPDNWKKFVPPS